MNVDLAIRIARKTKSRARHKWAWHCAVVVRGSNVLAIANNRDETHAEVAALNQLWPSERKGTKVYSMRISRTGRFAMAKPCPDCERYMRESGVKAVYYTDGSGTMNTMRL